MASGMDRVEVHEVQVDLVQAERIRAYDIAEILLVFR